MDLRAEERRAGTERSAGRCSRRAIRLGWPVGSALPSTLATAGTIAASLLLLTGLSLAGWPGERSVCWDEMLPVCFCERLREGPIAQPANTLSNFGFISVGLAIAVFSDSRRRRRRDDRDNPFTSTVFYPTVFAAVTALLGPGSMAMHASMTEWGGLVDVSSMYFYASLLIAYGLLRLLGLGRGTFSAIFLGLFGTLVLGQATLPLPVNTIFGTLLVSVLVIELASARLHPDRRLDRRFVFAAVALFLLAFAIWIPSLGGGPWCDPDHWVQGHAAWHLLCAAAAGCVFLYFRSERRC